MSPELIRTFAILVGAVAAVLMVLGTAPIGGGGRQWCVLTPPVSFLSRRCPAPTVQRARGRRMELLLVRDLAALGWLTALLALVLAVLNATRPRP